MGSLNSCLSKVQTSGHTSTVKGQHYTIIMVGVNQGALSSVHVAQQEIESVKTLQFELEDVNFKL